MFAPRRVVLLRDVAAVALDTDARVEGACGAFSDYAASPPPGSHLLVRAPKLDTRRKFHKLLAQAEGTLLFDPPEGADLPEAVAAMAKERGIRLTADAAVLLAELCAEGDLYRAGTELDKLGSWLGADAPAKPVDAATLAPLLAGGPGGSSFQVADAVVAGN